MEKSMNPSSRRSRRKITETLLQLMMDKPFNQITITEISAKADIVRRTFYRNFESKEDVIETYIYSIFLGYQDRLEEIEELTPYEMANAYFEYMAKHRIFLQLLQKNDLFLMMLRVTEEHITEINKRFKALELETYPTQFQEYYSAYNIAGIWHMLEKWLLNGMQETPKQLGEIYSQMQLKTSYTK